MILSGREIERQQRNGRISITPFDPDRVNPNSYNIALADELYEVVGSTEENLIDAAKPTQLQSVIKDGKGWRLLPGRLYLGRTVERTHTNHYVPILRGVLLSVGLVFLYTQQPGSVMWDLMGFGR